MAHSFCNQSVWSISSISNASSVGDFLRKHHYPNRVCFVGEVTCDMVEAAKVFDLSISMSETGEEYIDDEKSLLVFSSFECEAFKEIMQLNLKGRIMGAPALIEAAEKNLDLPLRARPILSLTMKDIVVCFTGFTDRSLAMELMFMIRCMGGSVRQETGQWITHIIACKTIGSKYDYARTFCVPVMSPEWVYQCWNKRYLPGVHATDDDLMAFRQKPFIDCYAAFLGFSASEEITAMKIFVTNGGELTTSLDSKCTHLIVDDQAKYQLPENFPPNCVVVRSEWLWTCVQQIIRAPEDGYILPIEVAFVSKQLKEKSRSELRKRQLQQCVCSAEDKENSNCCNVKSINAGYPCLSASSNDSCENGATPAKIKKVETSFSGIEAFDESSSKFQTQLIEPNLSPIESTRKNSISSLRSDTSSESGSTNETSSNKRTASFLELLQTEENYVKILDTILGIRDEVLNNEQAGGALLTETEAKVIFANLSGIHDAHRTILEGLRWAQLHWSDSPSVGDIFINITSDLSSAYAPFVNSFEEAKEMVKQCEEKKPRFHAFTKICLNRPECGRQGLSDLMIRPVQRLGSTVLLLREIKKHTPPGHPDFIKLQSALESLSEVLSGINEDKRKMETLCAVFDVFNLIEYCPADIIASHRSLLMKMEAVQLTESGPSQIGDHVLLFIFTDVLLLAKKKSKVVAMTKKPTEELSQKILKLTHGKPYKFLEVIPHSSVKRLLNVVDNKSVHNVFTVVTRDQDKLRENHSSFRLVDGMGEKVNLLESWCRALASHTCTTDPSSFLLTIPAEDSGLTSSEVEHTPLNKASRMMVKTQCLLGSVFGKSGPTPKHNLLRASPSFNVGMNPANLKSPSCSDLTDEMLVDDGCQGLKTSSLTQMIAKKL